MRLDEYNRILIPYAALVPAVFSVSSIKQLVARKKVDKVGRGGRGNSVEIVYNTMSDHYKEKIKAVLGDPRTILGLTPYRAPKGSVERIPFQMLNPKQLRECNAKYNLVKAFRDYAEVNGGEIGKVAAKHEFISLYDAGHLCQHEHAILGSVSFQSLERWNKDLREGGEIMDALAPAKRDNVQTASVTPEQQQQLISLYLNRNQPTITAVYRQACREWKYKRINDIPSLTASRRFLNAWIAEHNDVVTLHRLGEKAFKEKCMPYIERDPEKLQYMDCWVSDGRVMNFQIINPATGKLCRPTMIAWMDMRTLQFLGFELAVTESTMAVASAFRAACINAGHLMGLDCAVPPRSVYIDNGRAFKNKALGMGDKRGKSTEIIELETAGLDAMTKVDDALGVKPNIVLAPGYSGIAAVEARANGAYNTTSAAAVLCYPQVKRYNEHEAAEGEIDTLQQQTPIQVAAALRSANTYTDGKDTVLRADMAIADTAAINAAKSYADQVVAALVDNSPEALNTLQELAKALGNDPNFATTVMQAIGERMKTTDVNAALAGKLNAEGETVLSGEASAVVIENTGGGELGTRRASLLLRWYNQFAGISVLRGSGVDVYGLGININNEIVAKFGRDFLMIGNNTAYHSGNLNPDSYVSKGSSGSLTADTLPYSEDTTIQTYNICDAEIGMLINVSAMENTKVQLRIFDYGGRMTAFIRGSKTNVWRELYHTGNLANATNAAAGLMSAADKTKLDTLQSVPLAAYKIAANGYIQMSSGPKASNEAVGKSGSGHYIVRHNIGNTNYYTIPTTYGSRDFVGYAFILGEYADHVEIGTSNMNGGFGDMDFQVVLMPKN